MGVEIDLILLVLYVCVRQLCGVENNTSRDST